MDEEFYGIHAVPGVDLTKVVDDFWKGAPIDNSQCVIREVLNPARYFQPQIVEEIAKYGWSEYLRVSISMEDITSPNVSFSYVLPVLQKFITGIAPQPQLIIIDPYFYAPPKDPNYQSPIADVLAPFFGGLTDLLVITSRSKRNHDPALCARTDAELTKRAPGLRVTHEFSNLFHDRFWLSPSSGKGFITGTSLNGLGKKYSLIDYLARDDAAELLAILKKRGLI